MAEQQGLYIYSCPLKIYFVIVGIGNKDVLVYVLIYICILLAYNIYVLVFTFFRTQLTRLHLMRQLE